jgi:ABC-type sugar transport system permease subunit
MNGTLADDSRMAMEPTKRMKKPKYNKKQFKKDLQAYSFMLPNLILFIACTLYPVVWVIRFMFYEYNGWANTTPRFVGLANIIRVFGDKVYWQSVGRTFVYGFGKMILVLPLAFLLAYFLNEKSKANSVAQSIIFLPTIMSSAIMGLVFYLLFNVYNGEVNRMLQSTGIISQPINWLGRDNAMKTVILTSIWGGLGNYMVYFIAGIQQVSTDAIESAKIDGAGRIRLIWSIILPMMGPILKIVLMLAISSAFKDIAGIMVLTEGGPTNKTMVMSLYAYKYFFTVSATESAVPQYGYGAAVSIISAVIIGVITGIYLKLSKRLDDIY